MSPQQALNPNQLTITGPALVREGRGVWGEALGLGRTLSLRTVTLGVGVGNAST